MRLTMITLGTAVGLIGLGVATGALPISLSVSLDNFS